MTPIPARCARCDSGFSLFNVVEEGTGVCPHCLHPLVTGDPGALLEWAAVADVAHYRLSAAVHLLQQLGGHLIVGWRSVLQSLAEKVPGKPFVWSGATFPWRSGWFGSGAFPHCRGPLP